MEKVLGGGWRDRYAWSSCGLQEGSGYDSGKNEIFHCAGEGGGWGEETLPSPPTFIRFSVGVISLNLNSGVYNLESELKRVQNPVGCTRDTNSAIPIPGSWCSRSPWRVPRYKAPILRPYDASPPPFRTQPVSHLLPHQLPVVLRLWLLRRMQPYQIRSSTRCTLQSREETQPATGENVSTSSFFC